MYSFICYGHENIRSSHKTTFEITKDDDINIEADCIIGVKANYSLDKIKKIVDEFDRVKMIISVDGLTEEVEFIVNKDFNDEKEIVIRKSDFNSKRTLGLRCDKASKDFSREFVSKLKNTNQKIDIVLKGILTK